MSTYGRRAKKDYRATDGVGWSCRGMENRPRVDRTDVKSTFRGGTSRAWLSLGTLERRGPSLVLFREGGGMVRLVERGKILLHLGLRRFKNLQYSFQRRRCDVWTHFISCPFAADRGFNPAVSSCRRAFNFILFFWRAILRSDSVLTSVDGCSHKLPSMMR